MFYVYFHNQISSDQGIGVSDEMSDVSSSSAKPDDLDVESSEPDPSRLSSFRGNKKVVKQ